MLSPKIYADLSVLTESVVGIFSEIDSSVSNTINSKVSCVLASPYFAIISYSPALLHSSFDVMMVL